MRKSEIAKKLARQAGVTEGEAADRLDCVVREILARLRMEERRTCPAWAV